MSELCYPFYVVGFSLVTSTEEAMKENSIGQLWAKFHQSGLVEKLPIRISNSIFAVYSDYENQHFGRYRITIGYAVEDIQAIPEDCKAILVAAGQYQVLPARSNQVQDIVAAWEQVWNRDPKEFPRAYQTDLEEYQEDEQVRLHIGYQ